MRDILDQICGMGRITCLDSTFNGLKELDLPLGRVALCSAPVYHWMDLTDWRTMAC